MEPANVNSNSSSREDRQLAEFLCEAQPPLPDDGFTQRVMVALPVEKDLARRGVFVRWIICLIGAGTGLGVAVANRASLGGFASMQEALSHAMAETSASLPGLHLSVEFAPLTFALIVAAASLFYAFSGGQFRRSSN